MSYQKISAMLILFSIACFACLAVPAKTQAQGPTANGSIATGPETFYGTNPFGLPGARGEMADTIDQTATTYRVSSFAAASVQTNRHAGWLGLLGLIGCLGVTGRFRLS